MKRKRLYIIAYIVLVACLLPVVARGQQIVWEGVDTVACRSEWVPIGIGYGSGHEVVVRDGVASLTHVERIFLPDGVPCGGMGCAYRSPVTFTGFAPGGTIQSANDILYVRLKMEHSYLGDIYINITCPNGQVASLMNWSGMGSSSCSSTVPTAHRSWSSGTNASGGTFLGQAYDYGNGTYKCDSTATGNEPGVGWNYCWSSNTTAGYGYAAGDGRIYRATNVTGGIKDSSDVAGRTNFYHPDDHFSALVGCPLNGDWYIEVLDAYSQDNGYIFEWELSLDPELMPTASTMDSCRVTGDTVVKVDDSTFMVSTPAWVTSPDTTLTYTVYIYGSSGEVIDTTVSVRFVEQRRTEIREHGCDGDTISVGGYVFTESVTRVDTLAGTGGCPELVDIDVRFAERYEVWDTGRFCPGEAMVHGGVDYGVTGDYKLLLESVEGCDSTVYLRMELVDSGFRAEPYISDNGGEEWWNDTMLAGCVPYEMWMLDRSPLGVARSWRSEDSVWTAASDTIATTARVCTTFGWQREASMAAGTRRGWRGLCGCTRHRWRISSGRRSFLLLRIRTLSCLHWRIR